MMDRQKAIKLALEVYGTGFFTEAAQDCLMEFVGKVEREVRGDAEPVVIIHSVREGGGVSGMLRKGANAAEVIGKPLYTHPAPAVVAQLVEALDKAQDLIAGYLETFEKRGDKMPYGHKVLRQAQEALAAAKAHGVWGP